MLLRKMLYLFLRIFVFVVAVEPAVLANLTKVDEKRITQTVADMGNKQMLTKETVISHFTETTPPGDNDLLCWNTPIDEKCECTDDSEVECFLKGAFRYIVIALIILAAAVFPFFCYWLHKSYQRIGKAYSIEFKKAFCKVRLSKVPMPEQV